MCLPKFLDTRFTKCLLKWSGSILLVIATILIIIALSVYVKRNKNKFAKFETPTGILYEKHTIGKDGEVYQDVTWGD